MNDFNHVSKQTLPLPLTPKLNYRNTAFHGSWEPVSLAERIIMKNVLLTGAAGGLGSSVVTLLATRGKWHVYAADIDMAGLDALATNLPNITPIHMDVTDVESVRAARKEIQHHTDHLDAIVNMAGLSAFASLIEGTPIEDCERIVQVNALGMVRVNATFFDMVEKAKGIIVNTSSSTGWMTAQPFAGAYTMSKKAVEGYNDSLRREAMYCGVRVVKVEPGSYATDLTRNLRTDFDRVYTNTTRFKKALSTMRPMMDSTLENSGDPRELAEVVVKILNTKHPRLRYRKNSGAALLALEMFPEKMVDLIYRLLPLMARN